MKRAEPCRYPGCIEASNGAWYVPSASGPPGRGPFAYVLLCSAHGVEAERRGARRMEFVPKKVRSDERRVEDGVSVARGGQVADARRRR